MPCMKMMMRPLALCLAALLLAGCARTPARAEGGPGARLDGLPDLPSPDFEEDSGQWQDPGRSDAWDDGPTWDGGSDGWTDDPVWTDGLSEAQMTYGSAGLLAWPCVLYSIYLEQPDGPGWTREEIELSQQYLDVAVEWIGDQAARYGASPRLYHGGEDLVTVLDYVPGFVGGEDSDEGQQFYEDMDVLCGSLRTDELAETYGTENVGFLVFLPVSGCSFTMVHYLEDGGYYFNEYCCLYKENVFFDTGTFDGPAVYAHEILHLFGAPDLYEGSSDLFVTEALVDYVARTWPDAIMQDTYTDDGDLTYDTIPKSISPLTAYRLGLCDRFEGMDLFPEVCTDPPGTFRLEPTTDAALFEQDGAVAA